MALIDQYNAVGEELFLRKVVVALVKTAKVVQAEDETTLTVPAGSTLNQQQLHDRRSELAYRVLHSPESFTRVFAMCAAANATVTNASTDTAIEAEVAACWNCLSINGAG